MPRQLKTVEGAQNGKGLHEPTARWPWLLAFLLIVGAGVLIGVVRGIEAPVIIPATPGQMAEAGDLVFRVDAVGRATLEGAGGEGFASAADLKHGEWANRRDRLRLEFTLRNTGKHFHEFRPQEFQLRSRTGASWSVTGNSFTPAPLAPWQTFTGSLEFIVPTTEEGLKLVWSRDCCGEGVSQRGGGPDSAPGEGGNLGHGRDDHGRDEVRSEPR